jgi:hypothetical protein
MTYEEFEKAVKALGQKIGLMHTGSFSSVHGMLAEGENVKGVGSCIDSKGPGAIIVTERNFYAFKKTGIIAADSTVIPLEKITSFSSSGMLRDKLEISEGTLVHTYTTVTNMESILSAIKGGKSAPAPIQPKENIAAPPPGDKFEEIKKFKGLLDDGIISQAEFDKKKEELLKL